MPNPKITARCNSRLSIGTDVLFFRLAMQIYLWAMPLINTLGMQVPL
jgi:hypothetical protein